MPMAEKKLTAAHKTKMKAFMRIKPTLEDTAAWFEVDPKTIHLYIKEHFKCTFTQFREQNMVATRHDLIRKALAMAKKGHPAMLIFCLKNLCHWADKVEQKDTTDNPDHKPVKITPAQLAEAIKKDPFTKPSIVKKDEKKEA